MNSSIIKEIFHLEAFMLDQFLDFLAAGFFPLSFWGYFTVLMIFTHITMIAVTVFLHRNQTHRALDLHPIISHFLRFWLWITTGMQTKQWVAVHRKHHAKAESADDPHSPQQYGIAKILFYGADVYREACKNKADMERYGVGTPDDWVEKHIYTPHSSKGRTLLFLINFLLFGLPGVLIFLLQMMWVPFFAAGVINGIAHYWGYRNFECSDAARNIFPLGIFIGGEELHNNHHTFGTSAKFSVKWWEFDIGWFYIKVFSWLKLAKVKHLPTKLTENPNKLQIDFETVKALIVHRFHVLDNYFHEVVLPIFQEEKNKANAQTQTLFRRAKKLLHLENSLINATDKNRLETLLRENINLNTVYNCRMKLQHIWDREIKCQKERLAKLEEWCREAEASGIKALQDFSIQLKTIQL